MLSLIAVYLAAAQVTEVVVRPAEKENTKSVCQAGEGPGWNCLCPKGPKYDECVKLRDKRLFSVETGASIANTRNGQWKEIKCQSTATRRLSTYDDAEHVMRRIQLALDHGGPGNDERGPEDGNGRPARHLNTWRELIVSNDTQRLRRHLSIRMDFDVLDEIMAIVPTTRIQSGAADRVEELLKKQVKAVPGAKLTDTSHKAKGQASAYRKFLDWCDKEKLDHTNGFSVVSPDKQKVSNPKGTNDGTSCGNKMLCLTDLLRFTITAEGEDYEKIASGVRERFSGNLQTSSGVQAELNNYWVAGNSFLSLNDVYKYWIPYQAFGCTAQTRILDFKGTAASPGVCSANEGPLVEYEKNVLKYFNLRVEVQYHTECSLNIKQDATHDLYERIREPEKYPFCSVVQDKIDQAMIFAWLWYHSGRPKAETGVDPVRTHTGDLEKKNPRSPGDFPFGDLASTQGLTWRGGGDKRPAERKTSFGKTEGWQDRAFGYPSQNTIDHCQTKPAPHTCKECVKNNAASATGQTATKTWCMKGGCISGNAVKARSQCGQETIVFQERSCPAVEVVPMGGLEEPPMGGNQQLSPACMECLKNNAASATGQTATKTWCQTGGCISGNTVKARSQCGEETIVFLKYSCPAVGGTVMTPAGGYEWPTFGSPLGDLDQPAFKPFFAAWLARESMADVTRKIMPKCHPASSAAPWFTGCWYVRGEEQYVLFAHSGKITAGWWAVTDSGADKVYTSRLLAKGGWKDAAEKGRLCAKLDERFPATYVLSSNAQKVTITYKTKSGKPGKTFTGTLKNGDELAVDAQEAGTASWLRSGHDRLHVHEFCTARHHPMDDFLNRCNTLTD